MANRWKSRETTTAKTQPELEKVALYARVSSDGQAKELTIDRQVGVVNELYERHFGTSLTAKLVGLYKDDPYNLEEVDLTKNFWQIIKLIQEGQVNVVIVASEDRVFRGESAALRGMITDAFRHNRVKLITSSGVLAYDPADTSSRVASSVTQELGAIAKLESMKTMHDGRRRKVQKGDWYLHVAPYGLRCNRYMEGRVKKYNYVVEEEEAKIVRDVYRLYAGLRPLNLPAPETGGRIGPTKIARILEQAAISRENYVKDMPSGLTAEGWNRAKVLRILVNETYAGRLVVNFNPTKKVSGFDKTRTIKTIEIPAIVDDALFARVQEIYKGKRQSLIDDWQPRTETNWVHGLIQCPECDRKLLGKVASNINADRYYFCEGGHGRAYRCEDIEREVESYLNSIFFNEKNFKKLMDLANKRLSSESDRIKIENSISQKTKEKEDLDSKMDALLEKLLAGVIKDAQYNRFKEKLESNLKKVEDELKTLENSRRALALSKTSIDSISEIKVALEKAMQDPDKREKIYRLAAVTLIKGVKLTPHVVKLEGLSIDEIKELYQAGYVVLKDLREHFGWYPKKIYSIFGQTRRKGRIDFKVHVELKV